MKKDKRHEETLDEYYERTRPKKNKSSGYCDRCGDQKVGGRCPHCAPEKQDPRIIALENIYASVILSFCENLAELGCPRESEPDMWFRNLTSAKQIKVVAKLISIEERDAKRFTEEYNSRKR